MIKQIELTNGRHTAIPDMGNWRNLNINAAGTHKVGEYLGSSSDPLILGYNGEWPLVQYRTEVTADEFIKLWPQENWGEAVISADAEVQDFVAKLQNYRKSFDSGAAQVLAGMTAVVQNTGMSQAQWAQIIKGVPL